MKFTTSECFYRILQTRPVNERLASFQLLKSESDDSASIDIS